MPVPPPAAANFKMRAAAHPGNRPREEVSVPSNDEADEEPAEGPPDQPLQLVPVFRGGLSGSFELAQALLDSAGIPFVAEGNFDIGYRFPRVLRVRAEDAEEAQRLLADLH